MADRSVYGKVGAKLAPGVGPAGNVADVAAQFGLGETSLFQTGNVLYQAVYVYCGQAITGSTNLAINTGGTASASAGGYIAMHSASTVAASGEYIWARSSAPL